jgi:CRISPR-associated endonuclease/helicase Cas3
VHIVLISNCQLKAWPKTRVLLDRYASRIGERAWSTLITQHGLEEVYSALKRKATRQTSVACYKRDPAQGLRLLWIVGNKRHYDQDGRYAVATQTIRKEFPMFLRHAALIAKLSGYSHDFGKASKRFQEKLKSSLNAKGESKPEKDAIRHEWLSAMILNHIFETGKIDPSGLESAWEDLKKRNINEISTAQAVPDVILSGKDAAAWAVCTHHGAIGGEVSDPKDNRSGLHVNNEIPYRENLQQYLTTAFSPKNAPEDAARWRELMEELSGLEKRIRDVKQPNLYWDGVMLSARAALILADHKVSSLKFPGKRESGSDILFANTKRSDQGEDESNKSNRQVQGKKSSKKCTRFLDQPLSWHLLEVGKLAADFTRIMAGQDLPTVNRELVDRILSRRAQSTSRFAWQDRSADYVRSLQGGKLIFNVASTGAGKTLGNLKMAFAMNPSNARLAVAFNLRTLTTQTFEKFKERCLEQNIDEDSFLRDFACLIGDLQKIKQEFSTEDEDDVKEEDNLELKGASLKPPEWLNQIAGAKGDDKLLKLIAAPVLVSTMDWIVAAGEPGQQSRHAKALIRVANSDLILDEVDSYDVKAAVAVMKIVKAAATFGRNVVVSSATLNPGLAFGISRAYAAGRKIHEAMTGNKNWHVVIVHDEHSFSPVSKQNLQADELDNFYKETMQNIANRLTSKKPTKRYRIAQVESKENFSEVVAKESADLHEDLSITPQGLSCRISIGLVRVANVKTCMELSEHLRKDGRFYVTAYHARDTLHRRAWKEAHLDKILQRGNDNWIEALIAAEPWIKSEIGDLRLIVVATPVEEVGRDHDFDWAIIEPSSMHSIIQTGGRVNRHRLNEIAQGKQNIVILDRNLNSLANTNPVFFRPGLEMLLETPPHSTHPHHNMTDLMRSCRSDSSTDVIDASLVFDEEHRKTYFSHYDENSVREQIKEALGIIDQQPNFETAYMLKKFAEKFPLRDSDSELYELDLKKEKFRFYGEKNESGKIEICPQPEEKSGKTWLSISANDEKVRDSNWRTSVSHRRNTKILWTKIKLLWNGVEFFD